jgi:Ca2+-binding EF-hand superfamily protein
MRQHLLTGAIAALLVTGPALAQDKPSDRPAGSDTANVQDSIKRFDKNNDGALTREELPADMRDGFKNLDKNNDGKLNAAELKDHAARMQACVQPVEVITIWTIEAVDPVTREELQTAYEQLRQVDKDNDGKITEAEVKAARDQAITKRVDAIFQRLDANNDGKIAKDEAPGQGGFPRADNNNDGSLTKDELKAAIMQDANSARSGAVPAPTKPGQDK